MLQHVKPAPYTIDSRGWYNKMVVYVLFSMHLDMKEYTSRAMSIMIGSFCTALLKPKMAICSFTESEVDEVYTMLPLVQ